MGTQTLLLIQPTTTTRSKIKTPDIPIRVFLLSDHRLLRDSLARTLKSRADISLVVAQESSLSTTAEMIESSCDVLLVDPVNTTAFSTASFNHLRNASPNLRVVMIDLEAKISDVLSAILSGSQTCKDLGYEDGRVLVAGD